MPYRLYTLVVLTLSLLFCTSVALADESTYDQDTILQAIGNFFGESTATLAKVVEKAFQDLGRPNGYIAGEEISGAFGVGVRYGNGVLHLKRGNTLRVYWQGPSLGFDVGGNAAKVFVLVYNLQRPDELFQRFPGVDGSLYYIAGAGVNYQRSADITLAPIRLGVGLRAGANVGYTHYTRQQSWIPF